MTKLKIKNVKNYGRVDFVIMKKISIILYGFEYSNVKTMTLVILDLKP